MQRCCAAPEVAVYAVSGEVSAVQDRSSGPRIQQAHRDPQPLLALKVAFKVALNGTVAMKSVLGPRTLTLILILSPRTLTLILILGPRTLTLILILSPRTD